MSFSLRVNEELCLVEPEERSGVELEFDSYQVSEVQEDVAAHLIVESSRIAIS